VNALTRSLSGSNHQELKAHAAQLYQDVYSRAAVQAKTSQLYEQVIAKDRKEAT
jgi:Spy/CpxP family protein refolding chaperone